MLFLRSEQRRFFKKGAHAIGADFGRRMQPTKSAHARVTRRQDMLEKTAHELQRLQLYRGELAGFALAIGPQELALRQELDGAIGRGGLEEVSGKVTQRVESGTGGLATDVPGFLPYFLWNLGQQIGLLLEQTSFEKSAEVLSQRLVMEQEIVFDRDPGASIQAQAAAWNEIMNVGMKDQGARPGMEHAQHSQLRAQAFGIGRQVLQGLDAGGKEQVQAEAQMGADEKPEGFGHGEGDQEVRDWKEQTLLLARQPIQGVGVAALRTMPVIAGMIAVVELVAVRTTKELASQDGSAAEQDLLQDLPMPHRHGRVSFPISRSKLLEQLMDGQALSSTTAWWGSLHEREIRDRS